MYVNIQKRECKFNSLALCVVCACVFYHDDMFCDLQVCAAGGGAGDCEE